MSLIPFIVRKTASKRIVRHGHCLAHDLPHQKFTRGEEVVPVTPKQLERAKAKLLPKLPRRTNAHGSISVAVLVEALKAEGIDLTAAKLAAAAKRLADPES